MVSTHLSTIALIDIAIDDYQQLMNGLHSDVAVFILNSHRDGIEQITEILSQHRGVENLHIFAHGSPGRLYLGSTQLSIANFNHYIDQVRQWSDSLSHKANILLYGCQVAAVESGKQLVNALATLTGATIAASQTLTGHSELGGNWELEVTTGAIQASPILRPDTLQTYGSVLAKLDWSTTGIDWTPGFLGSRTYTNVDGTGIDVTVSATAIGGGGVTRIDDNNNDLFGGYSTIPNALRLQIDPPARGDGVQIQVTFSTPISNVYFEIYDIDKDGTNRWQDQVEINGFNGATSVNPTILAAASPSYTISGNVLTGTADSPNSGASSGVGTVGINFSSTITGFTLNFKDGPLAQANPTSHGIALLSNVTFGGAPPTTVDAAIPTAPNTTVNLTGLSGSDPDGNVVSYKILSLPNSADGLLYLGNPASGGTLVGDGQVIPAAQISNLFFQATAGFNGANFIYAAIDDDGAIDPTPAIVSLNSVSNPAPSTVDASTTITTNSTTNLTGLSGSDINGTVASYKITTIPDAADGVLYLGDPTTTGVPVGVGQIIPAAQISNLFFQATAAFNGGSFTYAAIDNDGAIDLTPATVTLNAPALPTVTFTTATQTGAENAGTLTITAQLSAPSAQPVTVPFTISGTASNGADYTITTSPITIPAGSSAGSITVIITDDLIVEGSESVVVTMGAPTNATQGAIITHTITITDNDVPGIVVTQSGGSTNVTEGGATDTYTVVLTSQPTANVTINLTPDGQSSTNVPTLTFTPQNWNVAQTVTVSAVNDTTVEGNHSSTITHTATSSDQNYNGIAVPSVPVTIADNDNAGITITPIDLITGEDGSTGSFQIVLNSAPTAPVLLFLNSTDSTEGTPQSVELVFDDTDWNIPRIITVDGIDDNDIDGNQPFSVQVEISSDDSNYNEIIVDDINFTNIDNDAAGITVIPTNLTTSEGGTTASFTVVLNKAPTENVTVSLTNGDSTEGTLSTTTLTFTPANWNTPQTVTVTGVNDTIVDGAITYTITTTATSTDPNYNGIAVDDVTVTNTDNDAPSVNNPPNAANSTASVAQNAVVRLTGLLATDLDGDSIQSYTISTLPPATQGTLYLGDPAVNGIAIQTGQSISPADISRVYFKASASFTGGISFQYTATDSKNAIDPTPAIVTLNLTNPNNPTNQPPVARDITTPIPITPNTAQSITGLNATDPDGTVTSYTITTLPPTTQGILYLGNPTSGGKPVSQGQSLTPEQINQLFFQATPTFSGASFAYTATDDKGATDSTPAIVQLGLNQAPIVTDVTLSTEPSTLIPVRGLLATDVDGTIAYYAISTLPSLTEGTLYLGDPANGGTPVQVGQQLTPDQINQLFFLSSDAFASAQFTYTAIDNFGALATRPATVTLSSAEDENCGCCNSPNQLGDILKGKGSKERLRGTEGRDRILGRGGNDQLRGWNSNDTLLGGQGKDRLWGGDGHDRLIGGSGADRLFGDECNDTLRGGIRRDRLRGGHGHDRLNGGLGNDRVFGDDGNDLVMGRRGRDWLRGGRGHDTVQGGLGRDRMRGQAGNDIMRGNRGHDWLSGGHGNDRLNGGVGNDRLNGGVGNDVIQGRRGHDRLIGRKGMDSLFGGLHRDRLNGGGSDDVLNGGRGNDVVIGGVRHDILWGKHHHDRLFGRSGSDTLLGGAGRDRLVGGSQRDTYADLLFGGLGRDTLIGGLGADTVTGGTGRDQFVYQTMRQGGDRILDFQVEFDVIDVRPIAVKAQLKGSNAFNRLIQFTQVGSETIVQIDGNGKRLGGFKPLLTLENVAPDSLNASHFLFS